jgi:Family of unknown function (DUF6526)
MPQTKRQDYANHVKWDPLFHFILQPLFLINLVIAIVQLFRHPGLGTGWNVFLAIALILLALKARLYALRVQDRVIRLEERLRLLALMPEASRSRVEELTVGQLIGLRFASDAEVPMLVEQALSTGMKGREIKKSIRVWRADYFRV